MLSTVKKEEAAYWNNEFSKCKSLREPYEKDWYLNLAFFAGKQYVQWTKTSTLSTSSLVEPAAPRYRVRLVANKIKPSIRTELTKLTKEEPIFYAPPATSEPKDVAAAKAAEIIADFLMDSLSFNRVRRRATFWMLMCGTSFIKTYTVGKTNEMNEVENDLFMDSTTPFHLYVPFLQEEELEKQPYIIHGRGVPVGDVKRMWGVDVKPSQNVTGALSEQKFLSAIGIANSPNAPTKDLCFVKEIWIKPCEKYPKGGLLVFAEDQLVYAYGGDAESEEMGQTYSTTEYPYKHGKYPFDKLDHVPSGSFYSSSVVTDLIPLQKEYNRTRSQIIESKNRMAFPQMAYVKGSLDPKKVTSEPGLMIPVQPGMTFPTPIQHESIPGYVIQELDRTLRDMDDLTSQYEISKGRTPPGVEAASAIAYLQEENDSKLYHSVASIEEATASIGKKLLSLVHEFWPVEKLQEIVSQNATFEAMMFKASNFDGNVDIRVEAGSMGPKSRAAKQAFITELMKLGIIPPEKGLRYLDLNETNRLYEELQADAKQAQRENFRITETGQQFQMQMMQQAPMLQQQAAMGMPIPKPPTLPVNLWDNHDVHLYEHGLFLKSQTFEMLDDTTKQLHTMHYAMHQQTQMQQAMMQQPMPGDNNVGPAGDSVPESGPVA